MTDPATDQIPDTPVGESSWDGSTAAGRQPPARWWPLVPLGLAVLLVLLVVQAALRPVAGTASPDGGALGLIDSSSAPSTLGSGGPTPRTTPTASSGPTSQVQLPIVLQDGGPILGITGPWEVLVRGDNEVIKIQPAQGLITLTPIPGLDSGGPVFFLTGPDETLVRPLDFVDGVLVSDRSGVQRAAGLLNQGPVFPGPDSEHIWVGATSGSGSDILMLMDWRGLATGPVLLPQPGGSVQSGIADGAGGVLFPGATDGLYSSGPGEIRLISTGAALATGPSGILVRECDPAPCRLVVVTLDGHRTAVPAVRGDDVVPDDLIASGVMSPDGRIAAIALRRPNSTSVVPGGGVDGLVRMIDLRTGQSRVVAGLVPRDTMGGSQLAWSPDSRWLFAIHRDGILLAVDRAGKAHPLGISLPPLLQLAIRPAGR